MRGRRWQAKAVTPDEPGSQEALDGAQSGLASERRVHGFLPPPAPTRGRIK